MMLRQPAMVSGRRAGSRSFTKRLTTGAFVGALLLGCRPTPVGVPLQERDYHVFERLPYVQAVDTSSAVIVWRAAAGVRDSFIFRTRGSARWRSMPVETIPLPNRARGRYGALPDSVTDRKVRLHGLPPASTIEYRVFAASFATGPSAFRTSPRRGSRDTVRVLAFGDSGWGSDSQLRLARLMDTRSWDLAVHVGDIAYQEGSELDFTLRHFHVYEKLLASVPFFPSPGNHDLRTAHGRPYDRAFVWPAPSPGARYYSFRWGSVEFLSLDSTHDPSGEELRKGRGKQFEWLRAVLDSVSRDPGVLWTIAYFHYPLYSHASGLAGHRPDRTLRKRLVPLFERYGVDLVLSGHNHHYERSYPMQGGRAVPAGCGPTYMVTGGGGASRWGRSVAPTPASADLSREHHFVELTISPEAIEGRAIGVSGQAIDSFRVLSYPGGPDLGQVPKTCR